MRITVDTAATMPQSIPNDSQQVNTYNMYSAPIPRNEESLSHKEPQVVGHVAHSELSGVLKDREILGFPPIDTTELPYFPDLPQELQPLQDMGSHPTSCSSALASLKTTGIDQPQNDSEQQSDTYSARIKPFSNAFGVNPSSDILSNTTISPTSLDLPQNSPSTLEIPHSRTPPDTSRPGDLPLRDSNSFISLSF